MSTGEQPGREADHSHPGPMFRMTGAIPRPLHMPLWHAQRRLDSPLRAFQSQPHSSRLQAKDVNFREHFTRENTITKP